MCSCVRLSLRLIFTVVLLYVLLDSGPLCVCSWAWGHSAKNINLSICLRSPVGSRYFSWALSVGGWQLPSYPRLHSYEFRRI